MFMALCAIFLSSPAKAQQACTEIGCVDGLTISTEGMDWPAGYYKLKFLLNNKASVECHGTLPLKPCPEGPSFSCNKQGITIGESGCALPKKAHAISDIRINAFPQKIVATIMRNGSTVHLRTLRPVYQTTQPNGPNCQPICKSATVSLSSK